MIRSLARVAFVMLCCVGCQRSSQPVLSNLLTAHDIYSGALEKARLANKSVFIVFTQDEFWCHQLEDFESEEDVARVLNKYFVRIQLRVDALVGAEQMYYEHGSDRGVPAYVIVDQHGEKLADSGDVGENIGFPNNDDEVERYLAVLTTACPEITNEEQAVLRNKLEAHRFTEALNK